MWTNDFSRQKDTKPRVFPMFMIYASKDKKVLEYIAGSLKKQYFRCTLYDTLFV